MFIYWLEIALQQLDYAESAHAQLLESWSPRDPAKGGDHLRSEFSASLQSICSAAFAVDAFFAAVKKAAPIDQALSHQWNASGTARYKRALEVFRRSFMIKQASVKVLKSDLHKLYKLRNNAVHPHADMGAPTLYPELSILTERRMVEYSALNARLRVQFALSLISQNISRPNPKHKDLIELCRSCKGNIIPLVVAWERKRGSLFAHLCREGK